MSKANRSAREKVTGGLNWWDYLNSIRPRGFRNTPCYLDYNTILNRSEEIKNINKEIKNRKKQEKKLLKHAKHNKKGTIFDNIIEIHKKMTAPTKKARVDMIQYGFDIAKWWNEQHEV